MKRLLVLLIGLNAWARVLPVPGEFPTIQTALNALSDGDTVVVAPGDYAEALQAPPLSFCIIGQGADSTQLPTIDPAPLPGSDTLSCLRIPEGAVAVLRYLRFRNGTRMYPHHRAPGGIFLISDNRLTLDHCVFDSVRWSIGALPVDRVTDIALLDCRFFHISGGGVGAVGQVQAERCEFSGPGYLHLGAASGSRIVDCVFRDNDWIEGHLIDAGGHDVVIRGCTFGPTGPAPTSVILTNDFRGLIADNTFTDCQAGPAVDLWLPAESADSIAVTRNHFTRDGAGSAVSGVHVSRNDSVWQNVPGARLDSNVFESCTGSAGVVRTLHSLSIRENRFTSTPQGVSIRTGGGVCEIQRNHFSGNRQSGLLAVSADDSFTVQNAQLNWWGDPTGPYHPTLNPDGQGRPVSDRVMFVPFLGDTASLVHGLPISSTPLPSIGASPNPFNSATSLRIFIPRLEQVTVDIFGINGRLVRRVSEGVLLPGTHLLAFDAEKLPSGVYFCRLKAGGIGQTLKLVVLR